MRAPILFAIVISMSTLTLAQTLPVPQAITDPKQISSKPNANVEQNQQSLSVERLYMTRSVGATAWSPDGKTIAFVSNTSGRFNLWTVPAEGGWPIQLTVSDQRQTSPAWSPDGKWIAYQSDYDGDEQWDIFFVSPKTGQVVNITNTREIAEENPTWSPDGRYLAYTVKPKTSSVYEIDIFDTLMRDTKHLTTGTPKDKMNVNPIWSKDGKWIVYTQQQAKGTDSNIFIAQVATGKSTLLTPHQGEQLVTAKDFSPDGKQSADHLQCRQWLRQRRPARLRHRNKSSGSRRTSGKSKAAIFLRTVNRSHGPPTSMATPKSTSTIWLPEKPVPCPCPRA